MEKFYAYKPFGSNIWFVYQGNRVIERATPNTQAEAARRANALNYEQGIAQ